MLLPSALDPDRRRLLAWAGAGAAGAVLPGCALTPLAPPASPTQPTPEAAATTPVVEGWHEVRLPGKVNTRYAFTHKAGRRCVSAQARASASMWRQRLNVPPDRLGHVSFSWWVDRLIEGANVAHADTEDAPARVLFGFGGDHARLGARTRMMFELAEALTGELPPYATLMYVWEGQAPVESVVINPRTDRIRKIVLDSGATQLGRWRDHRRDLAADFHRAFGEAPGPLLSVALMTDADNTRSSADAWYGLPTFN